MVDFFYSLFCQLNARCDHLCRCGLALGMVGVASEGSFMEAFWLLLLLLAFFITYPHILTNSNT